VKILGKMRIDDTVVKNKIKVRKAYVEYWNYAQNFMR
jgi:hypothetical protein